MDSTIAPTEPPLTPKPTELRLAKLVRPALNAELAVAELAAATTPLTMRYSILVAGVSAFAVGADPRLARQVMQTKANEIYVQKCEALAMAADLLPADRLRDHPTVWPPSRIKGFKKQIVNVLDGIDYKHPRSRTALLREISSQSSPLDYAHHLMRIFHSLIELNIAGVDGRPVLRIDKGAELAHTIGILDDDGKHHNPSARTFERRWKSVRKSIALSYAASTILVPKVGTLMDAIIARPFGDASIRRKVPQWIGRAKYVDQAILRRLASGKSEKRFMNFAGVEINPLPFQPAPFDNRAVNHLRFAY